VRSQLANQVKPFVKVEQLVSIADELGQFGDCLHAFDCNPLGRLCGFGRDAILEENSRLKHTLSLQNPSLRTSSRPDPGKKFGLTCNPLDASMQQ